MKIALIDTNIISFVIKGDSRVQMYAPLLEGHRLAVAFMTVAELFEWAATRQWGTRRRARLEQTLTNYIVIPSNIGICRHWGMTRALRQALGKPIAAQDAWIAATALHYAIPLITHNPKDFQDIPDLEVRSILALE